MMTFSTKGRYSLRVMTDLAQHRSDKYVPMKDVAARQGISLKYLEQILPNLTKNGLVTALHGKGGGYRLSRAPQEYTVGEILRAAEGDLSIISCLQEDAPTCERSAFCPTIGFWKGLNDLVQNYVNHTTLDMLIEQNDAVDGPVPDEWACL